MFLGYHRHAFDPSSSQRIEHVIVQRPLDRILSFCGKTIHDVINDPIARREVRGWFKTYKWTQRAMEISDLERQWNAVPTNIRRA